MANNENQPSSHRPQYRQNDDVRDPTPPNERSDTRPDSKFEARGIAREAVGNQSRETDANAARPDGNDKFAHPKRKPEDERFDRDLIDRKEQI